MIVITAPTGTIGRQVVDRLLAQNQRLRLIVRDASRLSESVRARVEIIEGSHSDESIVDRAFEGADAVFWLVPADRRASSVFEAYVDFSRPACRAWKRHGVKRVVGISALGRGFPGDAGLVTGSLAMDDLIAASGVPYRALCMPSFMDNLLWQVASLKTRGVFSFPFSADHTAPTCATRDIADVAVRWLTDSSWTDVQSVPVLGPEDLSMHDMATILSEVLEHPIRYEETSIANYGAQMRSHGLSEPMVQGMVAMAVAKNQGLDTREPRTPQGTTPTTFRQWCLEVLKPAFDRFSASA